MANTQIIVRLSQSSSKCCHRFIQKCFRRIEPSSHFLINKSKDFGRIKSNSLVENLNLNGIRCYSMDRPKSHKGPKKVQVIDADLAQYIDIDKMRRSMEDSVVQLKDNYIKNLSLRSAAGSIESLPVTYDGQDYTIQDLAQINRKNPKLIALNFSNFPQTIPAALEAINNSGMNLNPQQDGTSVYIQVPKVTKEHRENLAKNAKILFIKCKDEIRSYQNTFIKKVEPNNKSLSVEQFRLTSLQIKAIADSYIEKAESIQKEKEKELLGGDK